MEKVYKWLGRFGEFCLSKSHESIPGIKERHLREVECYQAKCSHKRQIFCPLEDLLYCTAGFWICDQCDAVRIVTDKEITAQGEKVVKERDEIIKTYDVAFINKEETGTN